MKVKCTMCGKKFRGEHGVKIHQYRMHQVADISARADATPENVAFAGEGELTLRGGLQGVLIALTGAARQLEQAIGFIERTQGLL